jgi:hypothetical protein
VKYLVAQYRISKFEESLVHRRQMRRKKTLSRRLMPHQRLQKVMFQTEMWLVRVS